MSSSTLSAPDLSSGVFTDTAPRDIAVSVRGLSKSYSIARNAAQHTSAGEAIMHKLRHPFEKVERDTFWALNDVSFDIQKGDVVGIIGRNGAGKSTLLKILSRITEPTKGRIDLYGRVGSLLEVGTGFHAELTGRENIFLNGAILGMSRAEIARQFDAIVDFSGVEQFLDTPVKRYSSGMYVRLAFAVAAHLNPEILIVDEVLAVGDAEFQKKCLGKMQDVAESGRTVLFVSHNMAAMQGLCNKGLLLQNGTMMLDSSMDTVMKAYIGNHAESNVHKAAYHYRNRGSKVSVDHIELLVDGLPATVAQAGRSCTFKIRYHAIAPDALNDTLSVSIMLFSESRKLANLWTNYHKGCCVKVAPHGIIECVVSKWPFRSQPFKVDLYTHLGLDVQDWIEDALVFESCDGDYYSSGVVTNPDQGNMFLNHEWGSYAGK